MRRAEGGRKVADRSVSVTPDASGAPFVTISPTAKKGVTLYDELAVANDIREACAASENPKHAGAKATPQPTQVRLDNLRAHFERGAITAQEYQSRRRKLLDEG